MVAKTVLSCKYGMWLTKSAFGNRNLNNSKPLIFYFKVVIKILSIIFIFDRSMQLP